MILETRAAPPFMKNGFVLGCETTRSGVVIDPGDELDALVDVVGQHRLDVRYILLTHAHLDHISGVKRAKAIWDVPVGLHAADKPLYDAASEQGIMFGLRVETQPDPAFYYTPGQVIPFGRYEAIVHHTPGHSPGGVCLQVGPAGTPGLTLIVGDTLFAGSIGRTDLPGGDLDILLASIRNVLFAFPDEAIVYSGHGDVTTIGQERRTNPFLV
jgi:glyoxylase-like metal-dependent hydrolase (beta-lactamase superfamily II)